MYRVTTSTKAFLCRSLSRRSPFYYVRMGYCYCTGGVIVACTASREMQIHLRPVQTHWEFVHSQRQNWRSQAANRQKTIAPPQPPSTPPPVYSNIGKMETLESRLQYVKHLFQLHAQRKIYLAAKSSCVCANSPSHGMDGGALAFRSPTKPSLLSTR